jgi:hypothetical protein
VHPDEQQDLAVRGGHRRQPAFDSAVQLARRRGVEGRRSPFHQIFDRVEMPGRRDVAGSRSLVAIGLADKVEGRFVACLESLDEAPFDLRLHRVRPAF